MVQGHFAERLVNKTTMPYAHATPVMSLPLTQEKCTVLSIRAWA
jgi:hypothetical protein